MQQKSKIEELLTEIYSQPDLKEGVFEYVQPAVLKGYGLLKRNQLSIENGDVPIFSDLDKKHDIEKILFRDLPEIIDVYKQMPLEYRNEHKLKNGQTPRQQLLDNIELLTKELISLENAAYEGLNQKMSVKSRVFKEIYTNTETELEGLQDNYVWKKPENSLNREAITDLFSKENSDSNQKIVVNEDRIEYKVKDKYKAFMVGTYNAFGNAKKFSKKAFVGTVEGILETAYVMMGKPRSGLEAVFATGAGLFLSVMSLSCVAIVGDAYLHHKYDPPTAHLIESVKEINVDNAQFREISIATLNSLAQKNGLALNYGVDQVEISVEENKNQCEYGLGLLSKSNVGQYSLNGIELNTKNPVPKTMVDKICHPTGNVLKVTMKLK